MKIEKQNKSDKTDETGFRYLMVSLFLAVLSFFIVLNTISEINQRKTKDVLENVREEFSGRNFLRRLKLFQQKREKQGDGANYIGIKELVKSYLQQNRFITKPKYSDFGKFLEIHIGLEHFYKTGNIYPKKSSISFIEQLGTLLKEYVSEDEYEVYLVFPYIKDDAESLDFSLRRQTTLSSIMTKSLQGNSNLKDYLLPIEKGGEGLNQLILILEVDEN